MPLGRLLRRALPLAFCVLAAAPAAGQQTCLDNPWTTSWSPRWQPIFQGIDWMTACTTRLPSQPTQPGVRTQRVNGLRIDLNAPGVQFFSAPKAPGAGTSYDTVGQRASDFVCTWGLQAAVNANFFSPCCVEEPKTPPPPNQMSLCGLAVSAGRMVSELTSVPTVNNAGAAALLITGDNQARITPIVQGSSIPLNVCTAVAGSPQPVKDSGPCPALRVPGQLMLLSGGANQSLASTDANPPESVAARTGVGISENDRFLYLLTIDGTDGSASGAGFFDEAAWLYALGAWNAINLDGGGSTTMVVQSQPKQVTVLNNPLLSCTERYVGTFLGVKALPLPGPPLMPVGCGTRPCANLLQLPAPCPR